MGLSAMRERRTAGGTSRRTRRRTRRTRRRGVDGILLVVIIAVGLARRTGLRSRLVVTLFIVVTI